MKKLKSTSKFVRNMITYLPVFIILLSVTIMIGATLAYFSDNEVRDSNLTFGKVELSSETNVGVSGEIRDAIPGTKLIDGAISFSKSTDSQPIYVRAKISFSTSSTNSDMISYVDALRNAQELGIITEVQNSNAVWGEKEGNYFYLLTADKSGLKAVDTTDTYVLTNEMIIPRDLEQLEGNAQYMESVNFHVAFQAIQVANVVEDEVKDLFNEIFPESETEKITYNVVINTNNGSENITTKVEVGSVIEEPETPTNEGYTFAGWYSQDGSESGEWGDEISFPLTITESTQIFAKWSEVDPMEEAIIEALNGFGTYVYQSILFNISEDGEIMLLGEPVTNLGKYTLDVSQERIEINLHDYIEYSYAKYVITQGQIIGIYQINLYNAQDELIGSFYSA